MRLCARTSLEEARSEMLVVPSGDWPPLPCVEWHCQVAHFLCPDDEAGVANEEPRCASQGRNRSPPSLRVASCRRRRRRSSLDAASRTRSLPRSRSRACNLSSSSSSSSKGGDDKSRLDKMSRPPSAVPAALSSGNPRDFLKIKPQSLMVGRGEDTPCARAWPGRAKKAALRGDVVIMSRLM